MIRPCLEEPEVRWATVGLGREEPMLGSALSPDLAPP